MAQMARWYELERLARCQTRAANDLETPGVSQLCSEREPSVIVLAQGVDSPRLQSPGPRRLY